MFYYYVFRDLFCLIFFLCLICWSSSIGQCSTYFLHFLLSFFFPRLRYTYRLTIRVTNCIVFPFRVLERTQQAPEGALKWSFYLKWKIWCSKKKNAAKQGRSEGYPQHESPLRLNLCMLDYNESVTWTFKICRNNVGFEKAHWKSCLTLYSQTRPVKSARGVAKHQ